LTPNLNIQPDIKVSLKQTFGIDSEMEVEAFSKKNEYVPEIDKSYKFDRDTTLAIISGFAFNKRVLVQGYHGTGKSTHIEQIAARLNWPCIRVNLDSHVSRIDLIGKDAIVLKEGKQVTQFNEGILPWSIQNPVALVFDEYDAGRPDVMFVIQRVLEAEGNFTLLDKNKVIKQNKFFRLFATSNTVGLGDTTGLYHGTDVFNYLLQGCSVQAYDPLFVYDLLSKLVSLGFKPCTGSISILLKVFVKSSSWSKAVELLQSAGTRFGIAPEQRIYKQLALACHKAGETHWVHRTYKLMEEDLALRGERIDGSMHRLMRSYCKHNRSVKLKCASSLSD